MMFYHYRCDRCFDYKVAAVPLDFSGARHDCGGLFRLQKIEASECDTIPVFWGNTQIQVSSEVASNLGLMTGEYINTATFEAIQRAELFRCECQWDSLREASKK